MGIYGNHSFWSWRTMSILDSLRAKLENLRLLMSPAPFSDNRQTLPQTWWWCTSTNLLLTLLTYLLALLLTSALTPFYGCANFHLSKCTHSLVWMCKLPLEQQMHSLTCMDVQTSTWATNALTHLYGCANFHLSNKCTHSLVWMCKFPLEQQMHSLTHLYGCANFHLSKMTWNKYVEYMKRVRTEALGAFGGHDLCGGGGGGGFLFNMTKNDPSNRTHPPAKTKKKKVHFNYGAAATSKVSQTKLSLPKLQHSHLFDLFAVSVSVTKLMNAIDLFLWIFFPKNK